VVFSVGLLDPNTYVMVVHVKIQLVEGCATTVTKKMIADEEVGTFYKVCPLSSFALRFVLNYSLPWSALLWRLYVAIESSSLVASEHAL
jgi:hypothetical protein